MGPPLYVVIQAMRSSSCLQGKGGTLNSPFFKTPSIGLAPRIVPMTSCSALKHSTNWAYLTAVQNKF